MDEVTVLAAFTQFSILYDRCSITALQTHCAVDAPIGYQFIRMLPFHYSDTVDGRARSLVVEESKVTLFLCRQRMILSEVYSLSH
jgi:hypothetical protein